VLEPGGVRGFRTISARILEVAADGSAVVAVTGDCWRCTATQFNYQSNLVFLGRLLAEGHAPGFITLDSLDAQIATEQDEAVFIARRTGGEDGAVAVSYTAKSGGDEWVRGELRWADGEVGPREIRIRVSEHTRRQFFETIWVEFFDAVGGVGTAEAARVTVRPKPQVGPAAGGGQGGGGGLFGLVSLLLVAALASPWPRRTGPALTGPLPSREDTLVTPYDEQDPEVDAASRRLSHARGVRAARGLLDALARAAR
jgi:hypothetical protein